MEKTEIKKILINNFVQHLNALCDDLLILVPNDCDILAAKSAINSLKLMNPKLLISQWHNKITKKYETQIMAGDINYALDKNYDDDIKETGYDDQEHLYKVVTKMKHLTKTLDYENQQKLVKYLQNLAKLTKHYFENLE